MRQILIENLFGNYINYQLAVSRGIFRWLDLRTLLFRLRWRANRQWSDLLRFRQQGHNWALGSEFGRRARLIPRCELEFQTVCPLRPRDFLAHFWLAMLGKYFTSVSRMPRRRGRGDFIQPLRLWVIFHLRDVYADGDDLQVAPRRKGVQRRLLGEPCVGRLGAGGAICQKCGIIPSHCHFQPIFHLSTRFQYIGIWYFSRKKARHAWLNDKTQLFALKQKFTLKIYRL